MTKCIYQMLLSKGYYSKLEMLGNACPYLHGHTTVYSGFHSKWLHTYLLVGVLILLSSSCMYMIVLI